ncbi:MAG: hypothetical protein ACR2PM_11115 [Hyphomicrobiales bacterium]
MSYDSTPDNERLDRAFAYRSPSSTELPDRCVLKVRLQAGASALPRLFNLMSKLDIEPVRFQAEKSVCGQSLVAVIDLGPDRKAMARLELRLKGLVTVLDVERAARDVEDRERSRRASPVPQADGIHAVNAL